MKEKMRHLRIASWAACLGVMATLAAGCATQGAGKPASYDEALVGRIDRSLATSARYLVARQSPDGAWRSETYGCFRDGPSLTPYVVTTLFFIPQGGEEARASFRSGVVYLVGMVRPNGTIDAGPDGLNFPVFTAAEASRVVVLETKTEAHLRAQAAWLAYLRQRQLTEKLGWSPSDSEYGGWGFSLEIPRKPAAGEPKKMMVESNLPSTLFGIAALRSAKVPANDPVYAQILVFVKRCQNYSDDPARRDPRFDDGGFFFIPNDALQNKGGAAGMDAFGRERYHSYGSMTADGLRALIRCGLPADHPRVAAARRWLETNFSVEHNPGTFAPDREVLRDATYYYYCWAAPHAFMGLGLREVETPRGKVRWAEALAEELMRRQLPDGSWKNPYTDAKEDDPLVATFWAAAALAICRQTVGGERKAPAPPPPTRPPR